MSALPGRHPQDATQPAEQIIRDLAQALHALHALPAADCPFDETTQTRLARAQAAIEQGLVEPEEFEDRNRGITPSAIYKRLMHSTPASDDLVVVHGDATFDNMLIGDDGSVGFIDCGHAGRGDRYLDLQAVIGDVDAHFGAEWIAPFARAYGMGTPDPAKLRFFGDLYELF
jgi:aminoglycoside 3'-phosphotransferase-2